MFSLGCTSDRIWNLHELIEYLSANQHKKINIDISPEAIDLDFIGLYRLLDCFDFEQVTIFTDNTLERHDKYSIVLRTRCWLTQIQPVDPELHLWNQSKKFFCFYHRPTAGRLGIAGHVFQNYKHDAHIHFSSTVDADNLKQFELDKLLTYHVKSVESAGQLVNSLPMLLSSPDRYTAYDGYYYDDPLTNFYQDILVDLVVESHVAGNTFFPTEKTVRPMWLKKPFVAFASKDYLCYLRQLGFMTFNEFWSEDYDGYEGRERFVRILDLIDQLAKKSYTELNQMYWSMKYVLDHNYNLLYNQTYLKKITPIS
jgi:hypothetical protein